MTTLAAPAQSAAEASPGRRSRYVAENAATEAGSAATTSPLDLAAQRSMRLQLLDRLQRVTTLDRLTHCRVHRAYGWEFVGIVKRDGLAQYAGLQTCESPWVCPMCSARIRHRRALALSRVVVDWVGDQGGGLLFPTLTLAHVKRDSLEQTLGHLLAAWRQLSKSGTWRRLCDQLGLVHSVRAVEITYGLNGWHPHLHLLLFSAADLTDDQAELVRSTLFRLWQTYAERHELRALDERRAVVVRRAGLDDEGRLEALGAYLSKVQDGYGIAAEVVRGDMKRGRRKVSRSAFQLAEAATSGRDRAALQLWHEYERVTKGRHVLDWSAGAKAALGYDESDDDDGDQLGVDELDLVADLTPHEWALVVRYHRRGQLLNAADRGGSEAVHDALRALRARETYEAARAARKGAA